MWLSSKEAAEILDIKYGTLVKSINRASKKGKKFCSLKSNILDFKYVTGVGGSSGKTLQIWIDDTQLDGNGGDEALSSGVGAKARENLGDIVNVERDLAAGNAKFSHLKTLN